MAWPVGHAALAKTSTAAASRLPSKAQGTVALIRSDSSGNELLHAGPVCGVSFGLGSRTSCYSCVNRCWVHGARRSPSWQPTPSGKPLTGCKLIGKSKPASYLAAHRNCGAQGFLARCAPMTSTRAICCRPSGRFAQVCRRGSADVLGVSAVTVRTVAQQGTLRVSQRTAACNAVDKSTKQQPRDAHGP